MSEQIPFTYTCHHCQKRVVGNRDFVRYHIYTEHPTKIRLYVLNAQRFKTGKEKRIEMEEGKTLDDFIEEFMESMRKFEERQKQYC